MFLKVFRDIRIELPLLLDTLQETEERAELGYITVGISISPVARC